MDNAFEHRSLQISDTIPTLQDLSGMIRILDKFYTKNGEFSDLRIGEWAVTSNADQLGVSARNLKKTKYHVAANLTSFPC